MKTTELDIFNLRRDDKIVLSFPNNGYARDKDQAAKFPVGTIFTVQDFEIHGWCTDITVNENDLIWNSVPFEKISNPENQPTFVFDLDGTLANCEHRMHHIKPLIFSQYQKPKKNWKAFFDEMEYDTPITEMVNLLEILTYNTVSSPNIIFCTGRPETHRDMTELWIERYLPVTNYDLFMRAKNDSRKDYVTKAELADQIIEKYGKINLWFDDRREVVKALRAKGITVLAVADND